MARYSLFVLKVPLNPNQPTNQPTCRESRCLSRINRHVLPLFCCNSFFLVLGSKHYSTTSQYI